VLAVHAQPVPLRAHARLERLGGALRPVRAFGLPAGDGRLGREVEIAFRLAARAPRRRPARVALDPDSTVGVELGPLAAALEVAAVPDPAADLGHAVAPGCPGKGRQELRLALGVDAPGL